MTVPTSKKIENNNISMRKKDENKAIDIFVPSITVLIYFKNK